MRIVTHGPGSTRFIRGLRRLAVPLLLALVLASQAVTSAAALSGAYPD